MVQCVEENLVHIASRAQEIYDFKLDPALIADKLIELENRSRQHTLRVDGIKEKSHQTWEDCERK